MNAVGPFPKSLFSWVVSALIAVVAFLLGQFAGAQEDSKVRSSNEQLSSIEPLRDSSKVSDIQELNKRLEHWDESVVASAVRRLAEIQGVSAMSKLLDTYAEYGGDFPPSNKNTAWDDDPGKVILTLQAVISRLSGGVVKLPKNASPDERDRFLRDAKAWWARVAPKSRSKSEKKSVKSEAAQSIGR